MTIKILVDMNLSPEWVPALIREGWEAVHWSAVGDPRAPDDELIKKGTLPFYTSARRGHFPPLSGGRSKRSPVPEKG
jgi:hypothetical protein